MSKKSPGKQTESQMPAMAEIKSIAQGVRRQETEDRRQEAEGRR